MEPTVDEILLYIEERLAILGISDREASLRATGKPDAIREIRRGKRPSDLRLRQLAEALLTSPEALRGEADRTRDIMMQTMSPQMFAESEGVRGLPRDIPVFGPRKMALSNKRQRHVFTWGSSLRHACRPPVLAARPEIFVAMMPDTSMRPRYELGEELYIDMARTFVEGDHVLVRHRLEADEKSDDWAYDIRRFVEVREEGFILQHYNPDKTYLAEFSELWTVLRVIPFPELLSY